MSFKSIMHSNTYSTIWSALDHINADEYLYTVEYSALCTLSRESFFNYFNFLQLFKTHKNVQRLFTDDCVHVVVFLGGDNR